MKRQIAQFKRLTAKRLRKNNTQVEEVLWRRSRELDLIGTHFRRQVPVGRYIYDFACLTHRLIVEVDGSQHGETDTVAYDRARTDWLEHEGYRVLRFWNNEVMTQTNAVMEAIYNALLLTPPRPPGRCSASSIAGDPPSQGEGKALLVSR